MLWALFWPSELLQPVTRGSPAVLPGQLWAGDPAAMGPFSIAAPYLLLRGTWGTSASVLLHSPFIADKTKGKPIMRDNSCPCKHNWGELAVPDYYLTSGSRSGTGSCRREHLGMVAGWGAGMDLEVGSLYPGEHVGINRDNHNLLISSRNERSRDASHWENRARSCAFLPTQ